MMDQSGHDLGISDSQNPLGALWDFMRVSILGEREGYRGNMNRFNSVTSGCHKMMRTYSQTLFGVMYMCIELDFFSTKVLNFMIQCQLRSKDVDAPVTTASSSLALDDRALRSTGANAAVVCMLFLSDTASRRTLSAIVCTGLAFQKWHEVSNRELRDAYRSKLWLLNQVSGGFGEHLFDMWQVLETPDTLRTCELLGVTMAAHLAATEELRMYDDEHAAAFGGMACELIGLRAKRCLWIWLPPINMVAMLSPDAGVAQQAVDSSQQLRECYEAALQVERASASLKAYLRRHPRQLLAVRQLKLGFYEFGWNSGNKQVTDLLHSLSASRTVSTPCAAAPLSSRQRPWVKAPSRTAIPPARWTRSLRLRRRLLTFRRRRRVRASHGRMRQCCASVWRQGTSSCQRRVGKGSGAIRSTRLSSSSLMRWGRAALGFLGLHHYQGSAVIALPVELLGAPGYEGDRAEDRIYVRPLQNAMVVPIVIKDLRNFVAFSLECRSWIYEVWRFPRAIGRWAPAVRAFKSAKKAPILEIAARAGFWHLSRSVEDKVCSRMGVQSGRGLDLFNNLRALSAAILPDASDDGHLRFLQHRLRQLRRRTQFANDIPSIDEALVCLDQGDQ